MINDSPRELRRARTRSRILSAARRVVAIGGIDALTLGAIAGELDLTTPALYRYFPNKGALLAAVLAEILREQREVFLRIERRAAAGDPLVLLTAIGEVVVALAEEQSDDFALLVATLADPRTLVDDSSQAAHLQELRGMLADLTDWVEGAADRGAITSGPARERVLTYVLSLLGCLQAARLGRFGPSLGDPDLGRRAARDILIGWGADRAALDSCTRSAALLVRAARAQDH